MAIHEVKFADFGEGLHEGEIVEYYVKSGDTVKIGDPLVSIQTDKMTDDVTASVEGKVKSIEREEGEEIHVGDVLLTIETTSSRIDEPSSEEDPSLFKPSKPLKTRVIKRSAQQQQKTKTAQRTTPPVQQMINEKVLAAPAVRRRAREAGVDLRYVKGSAKNGRITQEDLERHLAGAGVKPTTQGISKFVEGGYDIIPLKGIRKAVAKNMRRSKDLAAHYTYFEEVDMTALDKLRNVLKKKGEEKGIKVTYVAIVMKLLVPVLRKYPLINSRLIDEKEEIHVLHDLNIGISVDTPEGLIVPVVKHVDQKDVFQIASEIRDLATRAREGKLQAQDLTGGTFTITSIGNIGGLMATPIIKHPEVAILGLMKAKLRPVVVERNGDHEIAIRKMMNLSFSLDHRVIDGAVGARFIADLIRYMENPELLYFENV